MEPTVYIWKNGEMLEWKEATAHVLSHALHYGSGVFEGIRFYTTPDGVAIFRLAEHVERLFYSAQTLQMDIPYSEEEIAEAIIRVVKENGIEGGYIRPLVFYGYGKMGLNPIGNPVDIIIACWGWGKYLGENPLKVKISEYMRIHPKSLNTHAKVSGHYINSILASVEVRSAGYDEAILLDYEGNIAEGPAENLFVIKNGAISTPPAANILAGITRQTVFNIASDLGIPLQEKTIAPDELFQADELFFTGTAAEVMPIAFVNDTEIKNNSGKNMTLQIRDEYMKIVQGKNGKYKKWLTFV